MARAFMTRGDKSSSFVKTASEFQIRRGTETSAEAFHTKHFRYKPEGRAITLLRAVRAVDGRNNLSEYWGTKLLALALGAIKSR